MYKYMSILNITDAGLYGCGDITHAQMHTNIQTKHILIWNKF